MPVSADTSVELSHKGDIRTRTIRTATEKVKAAAAHSREHVGHIEIRLTMESNPARERPAVAEATLDVDGQHVRAHVAASTIDEAIDSLVDRLKRRLKQHEERRHRLAERRRAANSGTWRHGDRPEFDHVPFDEREVRRHKTFAMSPMSAEEAAFDLEQLGHEFYLFVDDSSGADAVVHFGDDDDLELVLVSGPPDPVPDSLVSFAAITPPLLGLAEAKEHLEASGDRHLFYRSEETGRGHVLYRRYDGHYGLVTPAD